jgi:CubicO group peptidase (beta-lactamase class C family)
MNNAARSAALAPSPSGAFAELRRRPRFSGVPMLLLATALVLGAPATYAAEADPFPSASPESQGLSSDSLGKLREVVRGFVEKGDIVGGELLVIKNRRTVLHEAVGLSDRENKKPLVPDTIYCIRSMTKVLTGAAVQILIDEGRLSLDDTAAKYLPSFDNDKSRGITVRQLLTHAGGLPLSTLLTTSPDAVSSLRDVVDISGKNGPTKPPGSGFNYSDDGADTLGAIVSVITKQPAEQFITQRILRPLGMHDTFPLVSAAGDKLQRFTPAYMGSRGNWTRFWSPTDPSIFRFFLASQGMYSTTKDYARFLAMYLDEGRAGRKRVLSKAAVKRTLEPANAMGGPDGFPRLSTHYGQLMVDYVDAKKKVVAFGHSGSDGTWAYAWPEHDLMVLFYTQSRGNSSGVDLEAAIDRWLLGGTPEPVAQELGADAAAPYLGTYWFEPKQSPMFVVLEKDRLALEIPWQGIAELKKAEERETWSLVAAPDTFVKFQRESDAPATAFVLGKATPVTLKRLEPETGLPGVDELFARRPDTQRAGKLAAFGMIRMSGSMELTVGQLKGSFEMLSAGEDRFNLEFELRGNKVRQIVAGERAWTRYAPSMPFQEQAAPTARTMRLNGWLLATGDWRSSYEQVHVLKRVELDGRPVFLVHAASAQGRQKLIYMDAENGLTLGYDEVQDVPGIGLVGCEVRFADYRDIEGVQIPFKATAKYPTPMLGTFTYRVEKIESRLAITTDPFAVQ